MSDADFREWSELVLAGSLDRTPLEAAEASLWKRLHCLELWMPGGCNLRCRHCYVASREPLPPMSESDYYALTLRGVRGGLMDVVVPGMEPLLREELWAVLDAASDGLARSVGMTTNATLLAAKATRLQASSLTVLNVSLDGMRQIHDDIRGQGVYDRLDAGVRAFRRISGKRILTNTTVNARNVGELVAIGQWCREREVDYAAFHPFELADEADNSLVVEREQALSAYLRLFEAFRAGQTGSIALEAEASTCWLILDLARAGILDNAQFVIDEAGLMFLRETCADQELLVGLNFYPHHFVRTLRITEAGGLSSCRGMARTGWRGFGDVRQDGILELARSSAVLEPLGALWQEYQGALRLCPPDGLEQFVSFVGALVGRHQTLSECRTGLRPSVATR